MKQESSEPIAAQPMVSREEFERIQQQLQKPPAQQERREDQANPAELSCHYLNAARTRAAQQPNTHGLSSLAAVLPKPEQPPKRTYTQERQVLVDVIADLAREFRDEATLTESVSRAYNLMGKAKITDIGVFTSKIYEARSITKERYGTIKQRMPYFFSVLSDVCSLKPTSSAQLSPSG